MLLNEEPGCIGFRGILLAPVDANWHGSGLGIHDVAIGNGPALDGLLGIVCGLIVAMGAMAVPHWATA